MAAAGHRQGWRSPGWPNPADPGRRACAANWAARLGAALPLPDRDMGADTAAAGARGFSESRGGAAPAGGAGGRWAVVLGVCGLAVGMRQGEDVAAVVCDAGVGGAGGLPGAARYLVCAPGDGSAPSNAGCRMRWT